MPGAEAMGRWGECAFHVADTVSGDAQVVSGGGKRLCFILWFFDVF